MVYAVFSYRRSIKNILFIRSYLYLKTLYETDNKDLANKIANDLPDSHVSDYTEEAKEFSVRHNGGQALPVIVEASENGFSPYRT